MMKTNFMLLTVVFGILVLDIEQAYGLKCYFCQSCGSGKGEEIDCDVGPRTTGANNEFAHPILKQLGVNLEEPELAASQIYDRCVKIEKEDGLIQKACATKEHEQKIKEFGLKCLEYTEHADPKVCFCYTDLCNGPPNCPNANAIGNLKPLAFLSVVAFVSTYSIAHLFF